MATENTGAQALRDDDEVYKRFLATLTQHGISRTGASVLLAQLFGGTEKRRGGQPVRGDLHIAYTAGEDVNIPGLVNHLTELHPNGKRANASNATYTGLVGTVRSKGPNAGWFLDNGALTDSSTSYLAIQHPHDLDDRTTNSLIEGIGSGGISISKKGFHDTVDMTASVLLIDTPTSGEWDEYGWLKEQAETVPQSLASTLDLIYADVDGLQEPVTAEPIEPDTAREYITDAQQYTPVIEQAVESQLFEALVEIHVESLGEDSVPQQGKDTLHRLSEACARIRHDDDVLPVDADRAIQMYRRPYEVMYGIDNEPKNLSDEQIDTAIQGYVSEETKKKRRVRQMFSRREPGDAIDEDAIIEKGAEKGLSKREVLVILGELKGKGEIAESRNGGWYDIT
ncbi:hypothetical protein [Halorussus sp. AFM4]|uniref:hypothetical protein n=1 Tax=Halorussus sp. AFM4 TaxID=3421651 RepID=UPI003EB91953